VFGHAIHEVVHSANCKAKSYDHSLSHALYERLEHQRLTKNPQYTAYQKHSRDVLVIEVQSFLDVVQEQGLVARADHSGKECQHGQEPKKVVAIEDGELPGRSNHAPKDMLGPGQSSDL
jgi:hypothetical protein